MSFRGTFLEIEPPTRMVQTWLFEGWPDAEAVETVDFHETDGVTTMTWKLAFRDQAGRDHMTQYDGIEASWDNVEAYLRNLQAACDRRGRSGRHRPQSSHAPWKSKTARRSGRPPGKRSTSSENRCRQVRDRWSGRRAARPRCLVPAPSRSRRSARLRRGTSSTRSGRRRAARRGDGRRSSAGSDST